MAPNAVKSALKTAVFTAYMLEKLGYKNVSPAYDEERTDIIQTLELGTKENLVNFTQGIQSTSPIDSSYASCLLRCPAIHLMKSWLLEALHKEAPLN